MFVRTKNGIYDFEEQKGNIEKRGEKLFLAIGNDYRGCTCYDYEEIIQEADTIEELCDEFRYEYNHSLEHERCWENSKTGLWYDYDTNCQLCEEEVLTIKGLIWTDKGLIYVAKMNEKGELEYGINVKSSI